ncbi:MAG: TonB-dependent receptor plug domain-containing protein, partial [Flavisolibacter sp.]
MKRIILGMCLISYAVKGQELKDSGSLEPVEVRAIRAGTNAPFAKTNLTYKEISHQNLGQDLPFLLNQMPSVVVNSDAGNGIGYTGIRIRGTDASRINVTLNGIPYNDAESQGTFFVDLPDFASSLKSIQVQRGVGTSSNGGGAFGATINLSTNDVNREPYLQVNNSFGSFQTLKNSIIAGSGIYNNHFTTDIRLSRISSNGYIDRASSHLRSFYFSNAFLSDKTDVRLNVFSGSEKTYQAWYGVSQDDLAGNRRVNYAGTEKPGEPYDNETDNYRQDHYQLFLTGRWHPRLTTSAAIFFTNGLGYYEQYKANQDYASYGMQYPVMGADTIFSTDLVRRLWLDNNFYGTVYSLLYNYKKTRLTLGGAITHYDGNHDGKVVWMEKSNASNQKYYNVDARKNDANIYGK